MLAVCAASCAAKEPDSNRIGSRPPPPPWLSVLQVHVERTRPAFAQNTEVFVRLVNPSAEPVTIRGLEADGAAELLHDGGATARIHAISAGVKKPIAVGPRGTQATSLLFEAAPGVPRSLRLYDRTFSISAAEGP